jgi:organic hydroperoxide reductase OsmC/OhrA
MASREEHRYAVKTLWTGAARGPTRDYAGYSRDHRFEIAGKPPIDASADPAFRGDPARHNPEDLLVAALSACHMLWYLHLCAVRGVVVTAYEDSAEGTMVAEPRGGRFTEVVLHPVVTITPESDAEVAEALHARAHAACFVANSVNFPVRCAPEIVTAEAPAA